MKNQGHREDEFMVPKRSHAGIPDYCGLLSNKAQEKTIAGTIEPSYLRHLPNSNAIPVIVFAIFSQ
jgi:hypothetical protein